MTKTANLKFCNVGLKFWIGAYKTGANVPKVFKTTSVEWFGLGFGNTFKFS